MLPLWEFGAPSVVLNPITRQGNMLAIEVNDTQLAYVDKGEGEPVVFVHGGVNDFRAWRHQLDVFGKEMRAVALSCRHYHPNEPPPDSTALSLEVLADDLAAFLDA